MCLFCPLIVLSFQTSLFIPFSLISAVHHFGKLNVLYKWILLTYRLFTVCYRFLETQLLTQRKQFEKELAALGPQGVKGSERGGAPSVTQASADVQVSSLALSSRQQNHSWGEPTADSPLKSVQRRMYVTQSVHSSKQTREGEWIIDVVWLFFCVSIL